MFDFIYNLNCDMIFSTTAAEDFGMTHDDFLKHLYKLNLPVEQALDYFSGPHWDVTDDDGKKVMHYALSREGYIMLGMMLPGEKATAFRLKIAEEWGEMDCKLNGSNIYNGLTLNQIDEKSLERWRK